MPMSKHFDFFDELRADRGIAFEGARRIVSAAKVAEIAPAYWRCSSIAEWFIRAGRDLGFDIRHRRNQNDFVVRRNQQFFSRNSVT